MGNTWFTTDDGINIFDNTGHYIATVLSNNKDIAKVIASTPDLLQVLNIIIANTTTYNESYDSLRNKLSVIERYAKNAVVVLRND